MISEEKYLEAKKFINENELKYLQFKNIVKKYENMLKNPQKPKWKCLLCNRSKFTHKTPHYCVGGYRKHKIIWEEIKYNDFKNNFVIKTYTSK